VRRQDLGDVEALLRCHRGSQQRRRHCGDGDDQ
jgi:hypothetical protein